jgi:two-component system, OmpR family, sensor histidine kinase KdpD
VKTTLPTKLRLMIQKELPPNVTPSILSVGSTEQPSLPTHFSIWDRLTRLGSAPAAEPQSLAAALASLALVGLLTIAGLWMESIIKGPNLAILYMLAVVFSALRWGRRAAIVSAVAGAFTFDFFFVPPVRSFVVGDLWYSITLIGLLAVGLLVSILTLNAKEEARAAQRREAQTASLYFFTKSLAEASRASKLHQILDAISRHVPETFQRAIVVLLPGSDGLTVHFRSAELVFDEPERAAAAWVFESGHEAGCGTEAFSVSKIRYRPLKTWQGVVGVIGMLANDSKELLALDQQQLLDTLLNQAALAITRADLAEKAARAELLQETDRLQKALLNSISHNLRTPITSVMGALTSVLEDGALLDPATQRNLLETAQAETSKLNRLVQNLLDMSRLEGGAIHVKREPSDIHDVIGAALEQLGEPARKHPISIAIAPSLPLVAMDQVLIVQVLVNLVDNALKYSPADAPIEIEARMNNWELEIRVADRGNGIEEQDLERVFDKFFRGASPGAPCGAGLGLSICKGFVNAHGGQIQANRRTEGGTEVAFFLPMDTNR